MPCKKTVSTTVGIPVPVVIPLVRAAVTRVVIATLEELLSAIDSR